MANPHHVAWIRMGVETWNLQAQGLEEFESADFSGADLSGLDLNGARLFGANFSNANLNGTDFSNADVNKADFTNANLIDADFVEASAIGADFRGASLAGANFLDADLRQTNFTGADLSNTLMHEVLLGQSELVGANLRGVDLEHATLVEADLRGADLTGARVYGTSVWDVQLDEFTKQDNLVITPFGESAEVSVDSLEVAQFVYLLLTNPKLREVIDTVGRKAVLILGRFTDDRKAILESIRDALRQRGYVPILFDFEKPTSRDLTETISVLAHLARFVVADLTDAKSIPQELATIVPHLPSVPIQPIILEDQREYGMFEHFTRYPWVLPIHHYTDSESLIAALDTYVISPAEAMAVERTRMS